MFKNTTYAFLDLSGAIAHTTLGAYSFTGEGVGEVNVSMSTEKTSHDVASDGSVMVSFVAGNNGSITISCQQTSNVHKWLLWAYNALLAAVNAGDVASWAGLSVFLRNTSDGTSHVCTGGSFQKVADKPYQAQGQRVTWTLMFADIQSMTA